MGGETPVQAPGSVPEAWAMRSFLPWEILVYHVGWERMLSNYDSLF